MKLLHLTAGAAPLLLLPALFASPLAQDVDTQITAFSSSDSECNTPCSDKVIKTAGVQVTECDAPCETTQAKACEETHEPCGSSASEAATVAYLGTNGTIQPASSTVQVAESTAPQEQIETLHALLRSQDSPFAEASHGEREGGAFGVAEAQEGISHLIRVVKDVQAPAVVFLNDVKDKISAFTESAPQVADSIEQALRTLSDSIQSGEFEELTLRLHDHSTLQADLNHALEALNQVSEQLPHAHHAPHPSGGNTVTVKTTRTATTSAPQSGGSTRSITMTSPHVIIRGGGSIGQADLDAFDIDVDVDGIIAEVTRANGEVMQIRTRVLELEAPDAVAPAPRLNFAPPASRIAPAAPGAQPHQLHGSVHAPRAPQSSSRSAVHSGAHSSGHSAQASSEIAEILSEMRAEMREMRASMAQLRAELESERSRNSNVQREALGIR